MVKRMLWKDIRQTLSKSKGRVVSIVCLMALGSFALVGLKVTGPDMQATAAGRGLSHVEAGQSLAGPDETDDGEFVVA